LTLSVNKLYSAPPTYKFVQVAGVSSEKLTHTSRMWH
jgi:hypothetical protein